MFLSTSRIPSSKIGFQSSLFYVGVILNPTWTSQDRPSDVCYLHHQVHTYEDSCVHRRSELIVQPQSRPAPLWLHTIIGEHRQSNRSIWFDESTHMVQSKHTILNKTAICSRLWSIAVVKALRAPYFSVHLLVNNMAVLQKELIRLASPCIKPHGYCPFLHRQRIVHSLEVGKCELMEEETRYLGRMTTSLASGPST
ncbi:hypothetical protein CPB84DRAFT_617441 [Gymnopilus junonius]|uniref:Uncharacterized protein n=1 Tax=Gymnopilus junonius TaxID=109634 RepID=A0A9P5TQQ9_GYMJU|nr:hypothetical protein CPB84DRAFT_617441 [Gymnopilus junonius]